MKCHYEVLGVPRDASSEDLKKAYRTLALRWHPDKNLDNVKEAQEQFLFVQQAYEVLCDPQERAFYDKHRESIIRGCHGGDCYKDDSLDVFPYFSSACFKGYGDDDKSFYSVYREVFNKIASEDSEFIEDSDFEVPSFGNSLSSYEDVVHPFYAYWQSYSTKKSYAWLDPHDIREAPNRRVLRLIEKENKKVRDKARKERNEEIRNLVVFVRKRDKRVQTYIKLLEEKASANAKKSEEKRKQQLKEKQAALRDYKESEWSKFSNVERELKEIEARMAAEFGDSEDSSEEDVDSDSLRDESKSQSMYCVACDKMFKTEKAFANHENSKKHKENVELLKNEVTMNELRVGGYNMDNGSINLDSGRDEIEEDDDQDSDVEEEVEVTESKAKKKKKRKSKLVSAMVNSEDSDSNIDLTFAQSKKQRKKLQQLKQVKSQNNEIGSEQGVDASGSDTGDGDMSDIEDADDESVSLSLKKGKKSGDPRESKLPVLETGVKDGDNGDEGRWDDPKSRKKKQKETKKGSSSDMGKLENEGGDSSKLENKSKNIKEIKRKTKKDVDPGTAAAAKDVNVCCVTCQAEFPSKNKLFEHLKKSGHSVYLPTTRGLDDKNEGKRTRKQK